MRVVNAVAWDNGPNAIAGDPMVFRHSILQGGCPAGTLGSSNVSNIAVACAAGGAQLQLSVTDTGDYARYGHARLLRHPCQQRQR